jgi:hypothetical protein
MSDDGVDILKVAERHAPEVVYLALKDAIEENQRLADTLRKIRDGRWNAGTGKNLDAREFARAALGTPEEVKSDG